MKSKTATKPAALAAYATLAASPELAKLERAGAREAQADVELRAGRLEDARRDYDAVAAIVADEDRLRTLDVKRSPENEIQRRAIVDLLVGDPILGAAFEVAAPRLADWANAEPENGLPSYLLGKNLFGRGRFAEAADYLDQALAKKLSLPRVAREAWRTRLTLACAVGDSAAKARALEALRADPGLSPARRATRRAARAALSRRVRTFAELGVELGMRCSAARRASRVRLAPPRHRAFGSCLLGERGEQLQACARLGSDEASSRASGCLDGQPISAEMSALGPRFEQAPFEQIVTHEVPDPQRLLGRLRIEPNQLAHPQVAIPLELLLPARFSRVRLTDDLDGDVRRASFPDFPGLESLRSWLPNRTKASGDRQARGLVGSQYTNCSEPTAATAAKACSKN